MLDSDGGMGLRILITQAPGCGSARWLPLLCRNFNMDHHPPRIEN